jgi:hypothetical protein
MMINMDAKTLHMQGFSRKAESGSPGCEKTMQALAGRASSEKRSGEETVS